MSIPLNVLAAMNRPYNHGNFCYNIIRDIRGTMEMLRLGVEKFFEKFPQDQENIRYLARLSRPFYILENEVDSWEETMAGLSQSEARDKLQELRARVFHLATRMGPAAEAYSTTIDPAKPQPEKVEPWRRVSADKLQKPLQLLNEAREVLDDAREELAYHRYKEQVLLNQLDESSQELAFLDLEREKVQSLKEQLVRLTQAKDLAVAQAHMAEHQANLNMQNFCFRFRNLKI